MDEGKAGLWSTTKAALGRKETSAFSRKTTHNLIIPITYYIFLLADLIITLHTFISIMAAAVAAVAAIGGGGAGARSVRPCASHLHCPGDADAPDDDCAGQRHPAVPRPGRRPHPVPVAHTLRPRLHAQRGGVRRGRQAQAPQAQGGDAGACENRYSMN